MVPNNTNNNNSILLEVLTSLFTVSAYFPDNPRISSNRMIRLLQTLCNLRWSKFILHKSYFKANLRHKCLAHIKVSDRAIKILSLGRPIYPVRLSQIGRRRAFTLKICTADHSWEHFYLTSVDNRTTVGRDFGSRLTIDR